MCLGVAAAEGPRVAVHRSTHPVMVALSRGVPLTLLMDLADPAGPDSRDIAAGELADLSWLRDLAYPAAERSSETAAG